MPEAERAFLVDPFEGWSGPELADLEIRIRDLHEALVSTGDGRAAAAARVEGEEILAENPGYHPAAVLAAQSDLYLTDFDGAFGRVDPVVAQIPLYTAAQLVRGRAAEGLSRIAEAYASYRAVADLSGAAAERAAVLEPRAVEIVGRRFRDALDRGELDAAGRFLERLRSWAPDAPDTLEGSLSLARARDDRSAELAAVTRLLQLDPDRLELVERRGELELEVGDPSRGLQIFQGLAEANPNDARLQERLEQAKFRWRLTLLPAHVQKISLEPELTRADFAVLVHWLVPRVRTSRAPASRIANDILDHPRREEIARVVNLGLMEVDSTLHTFSPGRALRRERALAALLRAVKVLGGGAECPGADTCAAAVACGLVADPSACADPAPISGSEALELLRRTLQLF